MMECKQTEIKPEENPTSTEEQSPEQLRREFLKKFGSYAVGSAVGMYVLMSPQTARAVGSDGG